MYVICLDTDVNRTRLKISCNLLYSVLLPVMFLTTVGFLAGS